MGDKDLENVLSSISHDELERAQQQAQLDRLKTLIARQKNEMAQQQKLIDELQTRIKNMYDLPADVEELKRMVGEMRAEINQKDHQLEMAYGTIAQHEAELRSTRVQIEPLTRNLDAYIQQVGDLKAKNAEVSGILTLRERELNELKVQLDSKQTNLAKMEEEFAFRVQDRLKQFMETEDQYQSRIAKMEEEFQTRTRALQEQSLQTEDQYQARIAKIELELRNQMKSAQDQFREKEENYQTKIRQLEQQRFAETNQVDEKYQKEIGAMRDQLYNAERAALDMRGRVESELRQEFLNIKSSLQNRISELEANLMDKNITFDELRRQVETAENKANEIKAKMEELMAKYSLLMTDHQALEEEHSKCGEALGDLAGFQHKAGGIMNNIKGLLKVFEHEPLFRTYLLVKDIGEMSADELKSALGVPSIQVKKFIEYFKAADLFNETPNGKYTLKHPLDV